MLTMQLVKKNVEQLKDFSKLEKWDFWFLRKISNFGGDIAQCPVSLPEI